MEKASLIISLSILELSLEEMVGRFAALVTFFFGSAKVVEEALEDEELFELAAETFVGRTTLWLGARFGSFE